MCGTVSLMLSVLQQMMDRCIDVAYASV